MGWPEPGFWGHQCSLGSRSNQDQVAYRAFSCPLGALPLPQWHIHCHVSTAFAQVRQLSCTQQGRGSARSQVQVSAGGSGVLTGIPWGQAGATVARAHLGQGCQVDPGSTKVATQNGVLVEAKLRAWMVLDHPGKWRLSRCCGTWGSGDSLGGHSPGTAVDQPGFSGYRILLGRHAWQGTKVAELETKV